MGRPRLYTLNENFFETIDTEEKAYWLGFIYADGYITKRKHGQSVLGIKLGIKDIEHLRQFCSHIGTNKPVNIYTEKTQYSTVEYCAQFIISNKIVADLEKLGVSCKKSLVLKFPENLEISLVHHFIRGYFDGDGSVFIRNIPKYGKIYHYLGISICGTENFLMGIKENLEFVRKSSIIFKDKREKNESKDIFNMKLFSNVRCKSFYDYIYKNSHTYLNRKKEIFEIL